MAEQTFKFPNKIDPGIANFIRHPSWTCMLFKRTSYVFENLHLKALGLNPCARIGRAEGADDDAGGEAGTETEDMAEHVGIAAFGAASQPA